MKQTKLSRNVELREFGRQLAAGTTEAEDRDAVDLLCRLLLEAGREDPDGMSLAVAHLPMPAGFRGVRITDADTEELIAGIDNFGDSPIYPSTIGTLLTIQCDYFGAIATLDALPTENRGLLEIAVTFTQARQSPREI